jgi:hypothetical protein
MSTPNPGATRRTLLACAAAAPLARLPRSLTLLGEGSEAAIPSDDPIVEALEAVGRARAAYERESEGDAQSAAYDVLGDAQIDLYSTEPTTPAGAVRLLRFIADFLDQDDIVNDLWVGDIIGDSIRSAVAVFEQEGR